jgi:hypothetical protein
LEDFIGQILSLWTEESHHLTPEQPNSWYLNPEGLKVFDPIVPQFNPIVPRFNPLVPQFDSLVPQFNPLVPRFNSFVLQFNPFVLRFNPTDPQIKLSYISMKTGSNIA